MLSRHVNANGARVLQLGGTTRDLFYYPKGTVQVTAAEEDLKEGLWEQAGMQAGVPVRPLKASSASALSSSAGAAFDSIVAFDQLGSVSDFKKYFSDIWRVRISGSPVAGLVRLGGPPAAGKVDVSFAFWIRNSCIFYIFILIFLFVLFSAAPDVGDTIANSQAWDFIQWDTAAGALDPHAVGVAIKPLQVGMSDDFSVDAGTFEQVMKAKQGKGKKKGGSREKGFGGST